MLKRSANPLTLRQEAEVAELVEANTVPGHDRAGKGGSGPRPRPSRASSKNVTAVSSAGNGPMSSVPGLLPSLGPTGTGLSAAPCPSARLGTPWR